MYILEFVSGSTPGSAAYYTVCLRDQPYTVGRDASCDIALNTKSISRSHATLQVVNAEDIQYSSTAQHRGRGEEVKTKVEPAFALVVSNKSKFGVKVHGHLISGSTIVPHGAELGFGAITLRVAYRPLTVTINRACYNFEFRSELAGTLTQIGCEVFDSPGEERSSDRLAIAPVEPLDATPSQATPIDANLVTTPPQEEIGADAFGAYNNTSLVSGGPLGSPSDGGTGSFFCAPALKPARGFGAAPRDDGNDSGVSSADEDERWHLQRAERRMRSVVDPLTPPPVQSPMASPAPGKSGSMSPGRLSPTASPESAPREARASNVHRARGPGSVSFSPPAQTALFSRVGAAGPGLSANSSCGDLNATQTPADVDRMRAAGAFDTAAAKRVVPLRSYHITDVIDTDADTATALALGHSLVLPAYLFELVAAVAEGPGKALHSHPHPNQFAPPAQQDTFEGVQYARPEPRTVSLSLFSPPDRKRGQRPQDKNVVPRSRTGLFADSMLAFRNPATAKEISAAVSSCGGTVVPFDEVLALAKKAKRAVKKSIQNEVTALTYSAPDGDGGNVAAAEELALTDDSDVSDEEEVIQTNASFEFSLDTDEAVATRRQMRQRREMLHAFDGKRYAVIADHELDMLLDPDAPVPASEDVDEAGRDAAARMEQIRKEWTAVACDGWIIVAAKDIYRALLSNTFSPTSVLPTDPEAYLVPAAEAERLAIADPLMAQGGPMAVSIPPALALASQFPPPQAGSPAHMRMRMQRARADREARGGSPRSPASGRPSSPGLHRNKSITSDSGAGAGGLEAQHTKALRELGDAEVALGYDSDATPSDITRSDMGAEELDERERCKEATELARQDAARHAPRRLGGSVGSQPLPAAAAPRTKAERAAAAQQDRAAAIQLHKLQLAADRGIAPCRERVEDLARAFRTSKDAPVPPGAIRFLEQVREKCEEHIDKLCDLAANPAMAIGTRRAQVKEQWQTVADAATAASTALEMATKAQHLINKNAEERRATDMTTTQHYSIRRTPQRRSSTTSTATAATGAPGPVAGRATTPQRGRVASPARAPRVVVDRRAAPSPVRVGTPTRTPARTAAVDTSSLVAERRSAASGTPIRRGASPAPAMRSAGGSLPAAGRHGSPARAPPQPLLASSDRAGSPRGTPTRGVLFRGDSGASSSLMIPARAPTDLSSVPFNHRGLDTVPPASIGAAGGAGGAASWRNAPSPNRAGTPGRSYPSPARTLSSARAGGSSGVNTGALQEQTQLMSTIAAESPAAARFRALIPDGSAAADRGIADLADGGRLRDDTTLSAAGSMETGAAGAGGVQPSVSKHPGLRPKTRQARYDPPAPSRAHAAAPVFDKEEAQKMSPRLLSMERIRSETSVLTGSTMRDKGALGKRATLWSTLSAFQGVGSFVNDESASQSPGDATPQHGGFDSPGNRTRSPQRRHRARQTGAAETATQAAKAHHALLVPIQATVPAASKHRREFLKAFGQQEGSVRFEMWMKAQPPRWANDFAAALEEDNMTLTDFVDFCR